MVKCLKNEPSQPTVDSFFSRKSEKRKTSPEVTGSKKMKTEEIVKPKDEVEVKEVVSKTCDKTVKKRCSDCRQFFDEVSLYPGDAEEAVEEFIMLTNPKLSLHLEGTFDDSDVNERPQHKITDFCVYDAHTHICPFDSGLIEKNVKLYFSGYVKPIYTEDVSPEGGVLARNLGPIIEWYMSGFDGGENALVGFGTAFAEYILMRPSSLYEPFMDAVQEKIYLAKTVIEFVNDNDEATYEDLLHKLHTTVLPNGSKTLNEESLLRHSQFVVDQVLSFDSAASEFDKILVTTPCLRSLIDLSGVRIVGKKCAKSAFKRMRRSLKKVKEKTHSLATTTPIVRSTFERFFPNQLEKSSAPPSANRRQRCGMCEACLRLDCGKCSSCRNMVKFGGTGTQKQACVNRRCPYMAIQEAEDDDILNDDLEELDQKALDKASKQLLKKLKKKTELEEEVEWVGEFLSKDDCKYYNEVIIKQTHIACGDFVFVSPAEPSTPMYIAKVVKMWETSSGKQMYHAQWFHRGSDTVLGEIANENEVFGSYDCDDEELSSIHKKCNVTFKSPPKKWAELGGIEDPVYTTDSEDNFYCQKWYNVETCRFEDPPNFEFDENCRFNCVGCQEKNHQEKVKYVELKEPYENDGITYFESAFWQSQEIAVGDCIFIDPDAYCFEFQKLSPEKKSSLKEVDEDLYPEAYRKNDYCKGSNRDVPEPFKIAYVLKIYQKKKTPQVLVKVFYRPEDTHRNREFTYQQDINLLYWSDEETTVSFPQIKGKCYVVYSGNLTDSIEEFSKKGPYRFYFYEAYDACEKSFDDPPGIAQKIGKVTKGKGKKSKDDSHKNQFDCIFPSISRKLRALDVFSGCGGLTAGFHQVGLAETLWAIEKEEPAAQAFRMNYPNCAVFQEDCNLLLKMVMEGKESSYKGQKLPQKGDVELLCGGPPCQGFSGMNRFNSRQYSLFKNSLVASYLSYCDYYRPKYFLLENVRNFVSFKRSAVLKLTLSCLISMGYQCTFGVLQAGNYGVPQTRRRAIVLAAAPGLKLPLFPEPQHVFSSRASQLSVVINEKKFDSNIKWTSSAPYRTVTVWDSMSDLPPIQNGARVEEIPYSDPLSHYQKKIRGPSSGGCVRDHVCKDMSPLVEARMKYIPQSPGSDWRDLPNLIVKLSDGSYTKKLVYNHNDVKNGKSKNGALRGVCLCATGSEACDPVDRQFNTLIPWCLPHTGNRHNHWAGLYGRLEWDGFFSTTITNPEPMGKQGRVLHPEQHRVVSVRECARSQGFPDCYRFFGSILDRHRQIGNAVPPPLSAAIGQEIKKAIAFSEKEKKEEL